MTFIENDGRITANGTIGIGCLGAVVPDTPIYPHVMQNARDEMIERRILRIEMALRRAGIEVENIDLPKVRP